jgi:hypothetical protein
MRQRWRMILLACAFALALAQGAGFSTSALAAPNSHSAVSSSVSPHNLPFLPQCTSVNDGAVWKSPSGITYVCRYVEGAGWQWVPRIIPCQPGAQSAYADKATASCG